MAEKFSDIVASEEDVARIIFSPSYIYNGRVAPTAFRWEILPSGTVEDYISVLRGNVSNLDAETRSFKARKEGDTRYGYALLKVGKIRDIHIYFQKRILQLYNSKPTFLVHYFCVFHFIDGDALSLHKIIKGCSGGAA